MAKRLQHTLPSIPLMVLMLNFTLITTGIINQKHPIIYFKYISAQGPPPLQERYQMVTLLCITVPMPATIWG